ncbi:MAG: response regulator transcription factor [Terriglobales bacterium]
MSVLARPLQPLLPRPSSAIRVALCLPSDLWNQLLAAALDSTPGLQIAVGPGALEQAAPPGASTVVIVVAAEPANRHAWAQLAQWCRREGLRVLVLGENRAPLAARALRLGACGYLDWESPLPLVIKAIRGVHAGELWAERKVALTVLRPAARGEGAMTRLTPRELRVLEALAEGKRNKEIAAQLAISETTVKSHLNRAYQKLHVSDRVQAVLYLERHGLD